MTTTLTTEALLQQADAREAEMIRAAERWDLYRRAGMTAAAAAAEETFLTVRAELRAVRQTMGIEQ